MSELNGTNRGADLAAQFRKQTAVARKEVDLPIPGIPGSPDFRFRCILRRIDVLTLIRHSVLPDRMKRTILGLKSEEQVADLQTAADAAARERVAEMTIDDLEAIRAFQREVAQKTCLAPKIVYEDSDDAAAINLSPEECEFGHQIVEALYNYAMGLSPDVPVATMDGGETTVAAVEEFPQGVPGGAVPVDRADGEELQPPAVAAPRNR